MNPTRTVLMLMLAVIGLLGIVTPASAHAKLESSFPAEGATLSSPPREVQLTFGEPVALPANPISVTGADGTAWTVGPTTVAGAVVTAPVTPTGPAGAYALTYRVISDDGDEVGGTIHFTLSVPATPPSSAAAPNPAPAAAPVPAPTVSSSGGAPAWAWVLIAVIMIGGAAAAVLRRRRT